jgi:hypothetical protein
MNINRKFLLTLICFQSLIFQFAFAQDESEESETVSYKGAEGFHMGFYIGGLWANKNAAHIYDGYGYDPYGNKFNYYRSYMYRKIVFENDPDSSGYTDQIAPQLGVVNHEDWRFSEDLMPTNLKYETSYLLGLAFNYGFDKKQSIILNFNFTKLKMLGNFTLQTRNTTFNQGLEEWTNHQFAVSGIEQRVFLQLGYSRILGNHEKANFVIEGGLTVNYTSVREHQAHINNLNIDLTYFDENLHGVSNTFYTHYNGWGFGGFGGIGLNLTFNPKYTIQVLYTPSYESINNGPESSTGVQNAVGLRAYYNF